MLHLVSDIPNSQARQRELNYRLDHLDRNARVQLLCLTIDDPYPPIRHDVSEALQRELDDDLTAFLETLALGDEPAPALLDNLQVPREFYPHQSLRARVAACVALEASPRPAQTLPVLARLIHAPDSDLRYQAMIALHHVAGPSEAVQPAIEETLRTEADPEIVVIASQIAISRRWPETLPLLIDARARLRGEDRIQLTFSIAELIHETTATPDDLPANVRTELIDECVHSLKNERLTAAAARSLAHLNAQEAIEALERIMNGWFVHPILRIDAAIALLHLNRPSGEAFIGKAISLKRKDARGYALRVIGQHRLDAYFEHLRNVAQSDGYHADTATLALLDFGTEEALNIVEEISRSHPDPDVRQLAIDALQANPLPFIPSPPGTDGTLRR